MSGSPREKTTVQMNMPSVLGMIHHLRRRPMSRYVLRFTLPSRSVGTVWGGRISPKSRFLPGSFAKKLLRPLAEQVGCQSCNSARGLLFAYPLSYQRVGLRFVLRLLRYRLTSKLPAETNSTVIPSASLPLLWGQGPSAFRGTTTIALPNLSSVI